MKNLAKTLEGGRKVFDSVETVNGVTQLFIVEMVGDEVVSKRKATFDDVAGNSPATSKIGQ